MMTKNGSGHIIGVYRLVGDSVFQDLNGVEKIQLDDGSMAGILELKVEGEEERIKVPGGTNGIVIERMTDCKRNGSRGPRFGIYYKKLGPDDDIQRGYGARFLDMDYLPSLLRFFNSHGFVGIARQQANQRYTLVVK